MSFFFDVWTSEGFILASDVRLTLDSTQDFAHKIARSPHSSKTPCAVVACGAFTKTCFDFFHEAVARSDDLRGIAHHFARKWTKRYAGSNDFSAVHLVGFERIFNSETAVPQVWYWNNWEESIGFYDEAFLQQHLESFDRPVPFNNHLPSKVKELSGKYPGNLPEEFQLVSSYLKLYQPVFSWNGDTRFWRSAAGAVGSAMNLLWRERPNWTIAETAKIAGYCLDFLTKTGELLPASTVGASPENRFDILTVSPSEITWASRATWPGDE